LIDPAKHVKLFAIQSSWHSGERTLSAIPVRKWIKFVFDRYRDTQDELAAQFPFLAE
jgi:hypothetical protein